MAPENDVNAVRFLVEHELALQTFVEREITGHAENSLEEVIRLLDDADHDTALISTSAPA